MERLLLLIAQAIAENDERTRNWFFEYQGHVSYLKIEFYQDGWHVCKESTETIERNLRDEPTAIYDLECFIEKYLKPTNVLTYEAPTT